MGFLRCEVIEVIALREDEPVCVALAERGFKKRFVLSDQWVPFYPADQHAPSSGTSVKPRICRSGSVVPAESIAVGKMQPAARRISVRDFMALQLSYSTTVTAIPLPWLMILLVTLPIRVCFPPAAPRLPTMIVWYPPSLASSRMLCATSVESDMDFVCIC